MRNLPSDWPVLQSRVDEGRLGRCLSVSALVPCPVLKGREETAGYNDTAMALILSGPVRRLVAPNRGLQAGLSVSISRAILPPKATSACRNHATMPSGRRCFLPLPEFTSTFADPLALVTPATHGGASKSRTRTILSYTVFGIVFASIGFSIAVGPVLPLIAKLKPLTDNESLEAYLPDNEAARVVEGHINNCDLARAMRARPEMRESRPHLKLPEPFRRHNLTAGTLLGPGRITVPPVAWVEEGGKSLVTIMHLGSDMCGHPGIVHGGLLATLLDEGLARCCFEALPANVAVTAQLEVNYRKPTKADQYVVLRARTTRVEGRKAWVEGHIETLVPDGETPVVLAEASGLFISPKSFAMQVRMTTFQTC